MRARGSGTRFSLEERGRAILRLLALASLALMASGAVYFLYYGRAKRPNVILVSLDTLRADHLGLYGYGRNTSPFLDHFGRQNVVFTNAHSESTWTLPSHWTMMSSLYPVEHGIKEYRKKISAVNFPTIPAILSASSYRAAAFTNGGYLSRDFGFHLGFDHFDDSTTSIDVFDRAEEWIDSHAAERFFVFIHTFEIHNYPLSKPEHFDAYAKDDGLLFRGNFWPILHDLYKQKGLDNITQHDVQHAIDLYDGAIRYTDERLRAFVEHLREIGIFDDTLLIFTADHGESIRDVHADGTYQAWHHGNIPYQEQTHVPLIIHVPPSLTDVSAVTIPERVGLIDIAPTILDFARASIPDTFQGKSLRSLATGTGGGSPRSAYFSEQPSFAIYSVVRDGWKFIHFRTEQKGSQFRNKPDELYDLSADPGELHNLAAAEVGLRASYLGLIDEYLKLGGGAKPAPPDDGQISDAAKERLKALGYLH